MAVQPRIVTGKNQDITGRITTYDYLAPVYAATININTKAQFTDVNVGQLTGALSLAISTVTPLIGDRLAVMLSADASARTVTPGGGVALTVATLVVTATKYATLQFVFNGTVWIELSRTVTA